MRMLFVGDVVGTPGRDAVHQLLGPLRQRLGLDVVVVNCENIAGGRGVTPHLADGLFEAGADVLTGGNHIWQFRAQIAPYMDREPRLIRPANYPNAPGRGSYRLKLAAGRSLGVVQVEGRVFMRKLDCPFAAARAEIARLGKVDAVFVDVHAEASSEKQALAWHLDGEVAAVIGSHTHVQTADERLLPRGTAYMTDAGMTGPYDSIIGMAVEPVVERFLTGRREDGHEVATDNVALCGAVVDIDLVSGRAVHIERLREPLPRRAG